MSGPNPDARIVDWITIGCPSINRPAMDGLLQACCEETKLHPTLRRHIHRVDNFVVKVRLRQGEPDIYGNTYDPGLLQLQDENAIAATKLVKKQTSVPIPGLVHADDNFTVWEYIDGFPLDEVWTKISSSQLLSIKFQIREFIAQLWTIPHPLPEKFAVGTLCSTHELLNDPFIPGCPRNFYEFNGPFKTVEEYRGNVRELYGREPRFPPDSPSVFDHMDWHPSNIILHPNLDAVAGIIDWEMAGFIPDPKDMYMGDDPIEEWSRPELADLFDGIQISKSLSKG